MLSPRLRYRIFELWTLFWSSGMTNPLVAIEQITYLLFIKQLPALDTTRQEGGARSIYGRRQGCTLRHHPDDENGIEQTLPPGANEAEWCVGHGTCSWAYIQQGVTSSEGDRTITPHDHLSQYVFPWLRELERILEETGEANGLRQSGSRMSDAYFQLPADKSATLKQAIKRVDELFNHVGRHGANADLMGDIFEYLLNEIQASGKNGQFRTPRHIIRFMIELINPKPGEKVADPAAGTGGFLTNTVLHIRKQWIDPPDTPEDERVVLLEWDGTPRRALEDAALKPYLTEQYFAAYDNDRTMVRIGWMNLVLHGIESPCFEQRDTLGKNFDERGIYDVVLANPPYTGTLDNEDLHEDRFPRNPRKSAEPITTKTEILFVWLILDLLRVGGRAAVIVPEGLLFGSTNAHKELRRSLLLEHDLQGVISLPGGIFQPYTGVKTSILVFQKGSELQRAPGEEPYTRTVWFYEVAADGYTLNAKRAQRPTPNDLWDALAHWPDRDTEEQTDREKEPSYFQPEFFMLRFRPIDEQTARTFSDERTIQHALSSSYEYAMHELFPELPRDPVAATAQIERTQAEPLRTLFLGMVGKAVPDAVAAVQKGRQEPRQVAQRVFNNQLRTLENKFGELAGYMKPQRGEEGPAWKALHSAMKVARAAADSEVERRLEVVLEPLDFPNGLEALPSLPETWEEQAYTIVREFAKLEGYDVLMRTHKVRSTARGVENTQPLEPKAWVAPVREYTPNPSWRSEDGALEGSHDADGGVRPEYVAYLVEQDVFEPNGMLKPQHRERFLSASCIEANDFNLSAGRYKPLLPTPTYSVPPAEIIRSLQQLEKDIQDGLTVLLDMMEKRGE